MPVKDPVARKAYQKAYHEKNKEKQYSRTRAWIARNPEKHRVVRRNAQLNRLYGIRHEDYEAMLERQGHSCAICESKTPGIKRETFAVDHCHDTGVVRGLLCNSCNLAIGLLQDKHDLLIKASKYLAQFKAVEAA